MEGDELTCVNIYDLCSPWGYSKSLTLMLEYDLIDTLRSVAHP